MNQAPIGTKRVAVIGASGYTGGELLRLLLGHPQSELVLVCGHSRAGESVGAVHPSLRGLTSLTLQPLPAAGSWPELEAIFLALPHGESMAVLPRLPAGPRVIDLGGDFRLQDVEAFAQFYGRPQTEPEWLKRFVYGAPELFPGRIAEARYVANPGCFATASILALAPLVNEGLVEDHVIIDAKTGSSGSGNKPGAGTHHPERSEGFTAYKAFKHQHLPEIQQALAGLGDGRGVPGLVFQAHSAPMVRGIFASAYARLKAGVDGTAVAAAFQTFYANAPFVRLGATPPNVHWVRGGNFADLSWQVDGQNVVVFAAIDNLGKGAAGQALQNFNLMLGLDQRTGLWQAGGYP